MGILLWPIVGVPMLGALILAVFGGYMPKKLAGTIGAASVGVSCALTVIVIGRFLGTPTAIVDSPAYAWLNVGGLRVGMGLRLDALSVVMTAIVTFVAFMILLYSAQSMYDQDGYSRFFAYMDLFVGSMLILVLAGNLLVLYLGWEGVGLCSYLLIGFWYRDRANGHAAQKAFIITRVGDAALAVALFMLFGRFGTLDIPTILSNAPSVLPAAGTAATVIAFLVLAGAVGKSAQIPLQTWLPDAMAGPTPVSALIHAATMVTAGVYLIARLNGLFILAPAAMFATAVIGAITLVYAGLSALVQRDIKRVLAYSTISQIGYMFLALGVGAWAGAIFHLVTHAFFKSLLFLSAGVVIDALEDEHDLFKMGGLRRKLPVTFWTFLIGAASLSALPFVTAGFYSKDSILWYSWASARGSFWYWAAGAGAGLLTAGYAFRMVFLAFFGRQDREVGKLPGGLMKLVLVVLAFLSIVAGFIGMPRLLGGSDRFGRFVERVLPQVTYASGRSSFVDERLLLALAMIASLLGIYLAYLCFTRRQWSQAVERFPMALAIHRFLLAGWGFDRLYDRLFVRPYRAIAYANRSDFTDKFYAGLGEIARCAHVGLSATQTGRLRNYAVGLAIGAIVLSLIVLMR